jgi:hypothetical protein
MRRRGVITIVSLLLFVVEIVDPSSVFVRAGSQAPSKSAPTHVKAAKAAPGTSFVVASTVDDGDGDPDQLSHSATPLPTPTLQVLHLLVSRAFVEYTVPAHEYVYRIHRPPSCV